MLEVGQIDNVFVLRLQMVDHLFGSLHSSAFVKHRMKNQDTSGDVLTLVGREPIRKYGVRSVSRRLLKNSNGNARSLNVADEGMMLISDHLGELLGGLVRMSGSVHEPII